MFIDVCSHIAIINLTRSTGRVQTSAKQVSSPKIPSYDSGLPQKLILPLIRIPAYVCGSCWLWGLVLVKGLLIEVADYRLWFQLNNQGSLRDLSCCWLNLKTSSSFPIPFPSLVISNTRWLWALEDLRSELKYFLTISLKYAACHIISLAELKNKKQQKVEAHRLKKQNKNDHCVRDFLSQNQ